jgi:hypothetical protein
MRTLRAKILWMPTDHILSLLIAERGKLTQAIEALSGPTKRRGRPPKKAIANAAAVPAPLNAAPKPAKRKRRTFSAAQRKQQGERMKAYWAGKRKAKAKSQRKSK